MISIRDEPMNRRTILWVIAALLPLVLVVSAEQVRATEPALTRDQVVAKAWLAMFGERKMNSTRSIQREKGAIYLFESNRRKKFTTRWIREITKKYARKAGITKRIHPHLFRHQILTYLTSKGIVDAKIQLISGHEDRASLSIYQDLSLADIEKEYWAAMKDFPVQ